MLLYIALRKRNKRKYIKEKKEKEIEDNFPNLRITNKITKIANNEKESHKQQITLNLYASKHVKFNEYIN